MTAVYARLHDTTIRAEFERYCQTRPPQQDCPHPNACLTCPDFQTTAEFLPVHQQQAELTRELLGGAETAGRNGRRTITERC